MGYFVEVESGVKLYVEDVGSGYPVVFVHGWPIDHRMFEYQTAILPQYGFRCIQIDLRGFGKSDAPWSGYGYDRLADDIRAVVGALRLNRFKLVGYSLGGAVVIRYMARHRGYGVSQLLLLSAASPSMTQRPGYPYGMPKDDVNRLIAQNFKDRPQLVTGFGDRFFASKPSPAFRSWFDSLGFDASSQGMAAGLISLRDEDLRADLPKIAAPTSIFHGKLDQVVPFQLGELTHEGIAGSVLLPFEHSGHAIFYDELELFNLNFFHTLTKVR